MEIREEHDIQVQRRREKRDTCRLIEKSRRYMLRDRKEHEIYLQ
jgi:hypothetical protein